MIAWLWLEWAEGVKWSVSAEIAMTQLPELKVVPPRVCINKPGVGIRRLLFSFGVLIGDVVAFNA